MKKFTEHVVTNDIGEEIHVMTGDDREVRAKKLSMADFLYSGEEYCPECHRICEHRDEGYWECPICFYSITDEESEEGYGYPTLNSTYKDDFAD